jgi:hypothetical protein
VGEGGQILRCQGGLTRLCAAVEPPDRDAELRRLSGDIGLDAGTREDDDPDRHDSEHRVVALEASLQRLLFEISQVGWRLILLGRHQEPICA